MASVVPRYDPRGARALAFGFAAAIHLLALLLILTGHRIVSPSPTPIVDLQLTSTTIPPPPRSVQTRHRSEQKPSAPASTGPVPPPAEPAIPSARSASALSPASPAPAPLPSLGGILRGAIGCDLGDSARLSPAERQACADRLAKGRSAEPGGALAVVSPRAQAAFEAGARRDDWIHQPFLAEKPKNGCRPMVVHQDFAVPGAGQGHEDWTTSVVCGKTF